MSRKPAAAFIEWARVPTRRYLASLNTNAVEQELRNAHPPQPTTETPKAIVSQIHSNLVNNRPVEASVNASYPPDDRYEISFAADDDALSPDVALTFHVAVSGVSLRNLKIPTLTLSGNTTLSAKNCWIGLLLIHAEHRVRVELDNCWVGHLQLPGPRCLSDTSISRGGILHFEIPPLSPGQPFSGSFVLSRKTYLPTRSIPGFIQGPQSYRNLIHHLSNMGNHLAANIVRRKEECLEREADSRSNTFFSYLYQYASDFGTSPLRPLMWFGLLFVTNTFIVLWNDGASTTQEATFYEIGWRELLVQTDCTGRFARAVVLALDSITNPLGIFGARSLLTAHHWALHTWLGLSGLMSTTLIALFIFALRRRFKIQ